MQGRCRPWHPAKATLSGSRSRIPDDDTRIVGVWVGDITAFKNLDRYVGGKYLEDIFDDSFEEFREGAGERGLCAGSVDRDVGSAARVLWEAANLYRDPHSRLTWLAEEPYLNYARPYKKRQPYPPDWAEQDLLFGELAEHLAIMGEFTVNTGVRDKEICRLEWAWEQRVPELDTPELQRTVFVLPEEATKCRTEDPHPRLLVLNDAAQRIGGRTARSA